ncbi:MAG: cyclic nucleotide-binding domain-containing protein [Verrucomicrobiota bacterium]|nr:cyclic nucleotide-binding domain-containing protein [Verrucomicrobiota bacterium]
MLAIFEKVHIFAGMDTPALDLLLGRAQKHDFAPGEVILREGDMGNRFYLVISGRVSICKHFGTPDQMTLTHIGPEDFFGEMCILEAATRSATVVADERAECMSLSSMDFLKLYEAIPAQYSILVLNIARDLSRRLRSMDKQFAGRH